jgi:ABC-type sugar transport system ATPase subunit
MSDDMVRASRQEREDMAGQISDQLLVLRSIGMEYGAIRALADVEYTVAPGEIVGLIGDNGAGKSTLVKIIAGNFPPTHGTMHFDRREVCFRGPEGCAQRRYRGRLPGLGARR